MRSLSIFILFCSAATAAPITYTGTAPDDTFLRITLPGWEFDFPIENPTVSVTLDNQDLTDVRYSFTSSGSAELDQITNTGFTFEMDATISYDRTVDINPIPGDGLWAANGFVHYILTGTIETHYTAFEAVFDNELELNHAVTTFIGTSITPPSECGNACNANVSSTVNFADYPNGVVFSEPEGRMGQDFLRAELEPEFHADFALRKNPHVGPHYWEIGPSSLVSSVLDGAADADGSGLVDAVDYTVIRDGLDINGDGAIDGFDHELFSMQFGQSLTVSAARIPEPSSLVLALLAFAITSLRLGSRV